MEFVIGADHGGFELKEKIKKWLEKKGLKVTDLGCFSQEKCDYPDYGEKVARVAATKQNTVGILLCGTGIGMCMTANKIEGTRAALIHNEFTGRMAKEHNNANVLCLGGRTMNFEQAQEAIKAFLKAEFQEGRHSRRVKKIMKLES